MNIFLVPHTWARHFAVAWPTSAAAIVVWWALLNFFVVLGPWLYQQNLLVNQGMEGPIFLGAIAGTVSFMSLLAEGSLHRRALHWRLLFAVVSGLLGLVLGFLGALATMFLVPLIVGLILGGGWNAFLLDPSTVALRYKLLDWLVVGFMAGLAPLLARFTWLVLKKFGLDRLMAARKNADAMKDMASMDNVTSVFKEAPSVFDHIFGATVAAALGAGVWQILGHLVIGDLYLAGLFGAGTWGFAHGLLVWGIPSSLYAGWLRILSAHRYGLRIPVDNLVGSPCERFIGHYPRGLDVFLPADHGVAELHASFVVDDEHRYGVRGLSQQPMLVKRFLEAIDLRYDPTQPAPLETDVSMEDRILLGDKKTGTTELEFILLPKEER